LFPSSSFETIEKLLTLNFSPLAFSISRFSNFPAIFPNFLLVLNKESLSPSSTSLVLFRFFLVFLVALIFLLCLLFYLLFLWTLFLFDLIFSYIYPFLQ